MEEKGYMKMYMLIEELQDRFNVKQWKFIKISSPQTFLSVQSHIKKQLMNNQQLYHKYFLKFHSNHMKLLNWQILAIENKQQIIPYVYKQLVSNGIKYYNKKIKQNFDNKFKRVYDDSKASPNLEKLKSMQDQMYTDFFNNMIIKNQVQNIDKPLNLKIYGKKPKQNKEEQMDDHDLYIKTFNACNGWNYIFYNYEKHMKGLRQKCKYNLDIRNPQNRKHNSARKGTKRTNLLDYEQEECGDSSCTIMPFNNLNKNGASSFEQLRKISKKEVKKLVLVNHQGKPITYRINRTFKA